MRKMCFHGKNRSKRWRRSRTGTVAMLTLGLGIAIIAWLSLVLSSGSHSGWHRLQQWQGSPLLAFHGQQGQQPSETAQPRQDNQARQYDLDLAAGGLRRYPSAANSSEGLSLNHIVFGIAGSARLWTRRKEFVKLWWKSKQMRGFVWLEEPLPLDLQNDPLEPLPPVKLSEDISRFAYTNPMGHPSGVRIARIVQETFRLGLPGVRWFVLGDDDTVFNVHNLIKVLSKYDPSEMHYIGSSSESHSANTYFSYNMAYGGGGIAISYPLAEALNKMGDDCLERYPHLFGSDDRLHACISELGIPLTREPGFHQWDVRGNVFGLLAGHPVTPFVSMHHLEAIDPVFPQYNSLDGLKLLTKAMKTEPSSFLQRSICYDHKRQLSFLVSIGYVVQIFPKVVLPRELERPERTFKAWNKRDRREDFDFDTRPPYRSSCNKPILYFLKEIHNQEGNTIVSTYTRDNATENWKRAFCFSWSLPGHEVQEIKVISKPMSEHWYLVPRRHCCKLTEMKNKVLGITVEPCGQGKMSFT